ncbi:MAG TPA: hypothetical protein VI461_08575 [Chitinophagaceae bacterium]|nr:hypothetical protein [Chitinophagaceae bacterium]
MIDNLIDRDEDNSRTDYLIKTNNVFINGNVLQESGLIENLAQTAAAGIGYRSMNSGENHFALFIGAISKLVISRLPYAGELLNSHARVLHRTFNASVIEGIIHCNEEVIAKCEMKLFVRK